jgi:hypothetical protein
LTLRDRTLEIQPDQRQSSLRRDVRHSHPVRRALHPDCRATQRRNVEALTAAKQTIAQGLQTVVRRQGEITRQSAKQFQDLLFVKPSSTSVEETLVKQIDVAKTSYAIPLQELT